MRQIAEGHIGAGINKWLSAPSAAGLDRWGEGIGRKAHSGCRSCRAPARPCH